MKVKVIKPFRDKHSKTIHKKGQEIEVTQERYEEINSAALGPFVEKITEAKTDEQKKTATKKRSR